LLIGTQIITIKVVKIIKCKDKITLAMLGFLNVAILANIGWYLYEIYINNECLKANFNVFAVN